MCLVFKPHRRHCVVSLSKNFNSSLVLFQPRKTQPFITERLLMGRKESNQASKIVNFPFLDGDVPHSPSYSVYISHLICLARVCSNVDDFNNRNLL